MLRITDGKGFGVSFKNGYTVSVQFGPGNYSDHYDRRIGSDEIACGREGSMTAECAVIDPSGNLIPHPLGDDDTVSNRSSADEVLTLLNWAAIQGSKPHVQKVILTEDGELQLEEKLGKLWDLLHEVAPFIPVSYVNLHSRVQSALDDGAGDPK